MQSKGKILRACKICPAKWADGYVQIIGNDIANWDMALFRQQEIEIERGDLHGWYDYTHIVRVIYHPELYNDGFVGVYLAKIAE